MDEWITAQEVIESGKLSITNLVAQVHNGTLVAHDYQSFSPVDWPQLEKQFKEIQAMSGQKITVKRPQKTGESSYWRTSGIIALRQDPAPIDPLTTQHDEWQDRNGNTWRTPRLSWAVLHDQLTRQERPTIPVSQYEEILAGWGSRQIEEIVLQSIFREADILKITGQGQGDRAATGPKGSPQWTKARANLLKVIGALVQIHYLETTKLNTKFMKNDGSVNAKTVSEDIHEGLRRAGIENFAGLEERTLRDKISEGLSALAENRA